MFFEVLSVVIFKNVCTLFQSFQPLEMKKRKISPKLNAIIANVWGADQVRNREIVENVWKILLGDGSPKREVSGQNGRVGIFVLLRKFKALDITKRPLNTF